MNNQSNLEPGKTEAERFLRQPQGTLPTNTANVVKRITTLESKVTTLENRQNLFIDHWTIASADVLGNKRNNNGVIEQYDGSAWVVVTIEEGDVWFDSEATDLSVYNNAAWTIIPLSSESVYINRVDNISYVWTGSIMTPASSVLSFATKEEAEAGISEEDVMSPKTTLDAINYNKLVRTIALPAFDIVLKDGDDFTKLTGMGTNQAFTINSEGLIIKKAFRLIITGGTLAVPTFTGYTVNWILTSLVTDYVPAKINYLICEIRSAGQIYCFWGA